MKNLVVLLFVMLIGPVTAQNIFTSGYIVTEAGDTIRGLIYEKSDAELSRKLTFKTSESAEEQKYTNRNIVAFGFESGREFERRVLLPKLRMDGDTTYIFAKNLIRGNIDVFAGRQFQKKNPDLFLDHNSKNTSIQIYSSRNAEALSFEEFAKVFKSNPKILQNPLGVKFTEKRLLRNIASHNDTVKNNFPVLVYREKIEYNWDLIGGLPIDNSRQAVHFRIGVYLNKTRVERTSKFSLLHGIIYHHWEKDDILIPEGITQGEINKKWQLFNIIPIGIKFQGDSGAFRPYGYIGVGAALLRETNIRVVNDIANEDHIRWKFFPTINSGIGLRTRIGQHYLITEFTPTINNLFLNLGLSL